MAFLALLICTLANIGELIHGLDGTAIGNIANDTTLTVKDSPYIISGSVSISADVVVTIENGVEIIFENNVYWNVYGSIMAGCDSLETDSDETTKGLTNTTTFTHIHGDFDEDYHMGVIQFLSAGSGEFCNVKFESMYYAFSYATYPSNPSSCDNCEFTDVTYAVYGTGTTSTYQWHSFTDCSYYNLSSITYCAQVDFERCKFEDFSSFSTCRETNIYDSEIIGDGTQTCVDYTSYIGDVMGNTFRDCGEALEYRYGSSSSSSAKQIQYNTFENNGIAVISEYDYWGYTTVTYNNFISNGINIQLYWGEDLNASYNYFGDDNGALNQTMIQSKIKDECDLFGSAWVTFYPWYDSAIDFDADSTPNTVSLSGEALECLDRHNDIDDEDELKRIYFENVTLSTNNTYYVVHDTIIDKGAALYVENGANIVFKGDYTLEVRGTLIIGCNDVDVAADSNIGLLSAEENYTTISYASSYTDGGQIELGLNADATVKICNTKFVRLDYGIYISNNPAGHTVEIENCEFDSCPYAIYNPNSVQDAAEEFNITIKDSSIHDGTYAFYGAGTYDHCQLDFVHIHTGYRGLTVMNSIIDASRSSSSYCFYAHTWYEQVIENNIIKNCEEAIRVYAYYYSDRDAISIRYNTFINNSVAIYVSYSYSDSQVAVEYNNFINNTINVEVNRLYYGASWENNYFGTNDEDEIRHKIIDVCNDDSGYTYSTHSTYRRLVYWPYFITEIDTDNFDKNNLPQTAVPTTDNNQCVGSNPYAATKNYTDNFLPFSIGFDMVLTVDESPYYVVQNVLVEEGATLTMENGAELIFIDNQYIDIEGALVIGCDDIDTESDTKTRGLIDDTTFVSISVETPYQSGFRIHPSYSSDYLNNPKITVRICNAEISGFTQFMQCSSYCHANITFDNVEFQDNDQSSWTGIMQFTSTNFPDNTYLLRDSIINNTRYGIYGYYWRMENNLFDTDYYSRAYGYNTIIGNEFIGGSSSYAALYIYNYDNLVTGNYIHGSFTGLRVYGYEGNIIEYNTIEDCRYCVQFSSSGHNAFHYNNLIDCTYYALYASSYRGVINASFNYFEDSAGNALTETQIPTEVYDVCDRYGDSVIYWYPFVNSEINISDTSTIPTDITEVNTTMIYNQLCNSKRWSTTYQPALRAYYVEDETLYAAQSPYYLLSSVVILEGVTLTVENGVEIIGTSSSFEIAVLGTLDIGCNNIDTSGYDGHGLMNEQNFSYFHYLNHPNTYSSYGEIYMLTDSQINICNTKFENYRIIDDTNSNDYGQSLFIDNCEFSRTSRPIYLTANPIDDPNERIVKDSHFHNFTSELYIYSATFDNNLFEDFNDDAIRAYQYGNQQPFILQNNIIRNPRVLYSVYSDMIYVYMYNRIDGQAKSYFVGNQVLNGGIGMELRSYSYSTDETIAGNTFENNYIGIRVYASSGSAPISCNNFYNNTLYNIEYRSWPDANWANNYWGVDDNTDKDQIEEKLYYLYDSDSYDRIYWPWFTQAIGNINNLPPALTYDPDSGEISSTTVDSCDINIPTRDPTTATPSTSPTTPFPSTSPTTASPSTSPTTAAPTAPSINPTAAPTRLQCIQYPEDDWNYIIDGNACTVSGDPHFRTWNGVYHDYQGQNSQQYGYITHCRDIGHGLKVLKSAMPFEMFGKHRQIGSASVHVLEYVTLKLYDDDGKRYFVHLGSNIACWYWQKLATAPKSFYDNNQVLCTAHNFAANTDQSIGNIFNVRYMETCTYYWWSTTPRCRRDVVLTIDGICEIKFYVNTYSLVVEPPNCYKCFMCGLCGDFGQQNLAGNENQGNLMRTCDGGPSQIIRGWSSDNTFAYDANGISWLVNQEGELCNNTDTTTRRRLAAFYQPDTGDDFVYVDPCDDAIKQDVIDACQQARDDESDCCDLIDESGTVCDQLQEDCDIDVCASAEGNASLIDRYVQEIFIDSVAMLCNISAEANYSLFEPNNTVANTENGEEVVVSILDILEGVCDEEIGTFNWDLLTEEGQDIPAFNVTDFYVDESDLSLNIRVELQYVGSVYADDDNEANWGMTYVLDFEDFDAHKSAINEPGTCGNKKAKSFENATFDEYWQYSREVIFEGVGNADNLAYGPPGDEWEIYMKEGEECSTVVYEGHFTWNELRGCTAFGGGDSYTEVDASDEGWLVLTGTFYINVVSPFWYDSDYGYYRVYQLLSQPFVIQVSTTVYVLGETGINVMTLSIIAVYKEDDDKDYTLILLTETAEYMQLANPVLVSVPLSDQYTLAIQEDAENGDGCLGNKQFICSQLWKISANDTTCTADYDGTTGGIDFSGTYQLRFDPQCRSGSGASGYNFTSHCSEWLEDHSDFNPNQNGVVLQSELTFIDGICKAEVFTVQLLAEMSFYPDDTYSEQVDDSHLYQVGEDEVYVEIIVDFPDDTFNVFDTELINVWLCTFPPETDVAEPSQTGQEGGCFDSQRDGYDSTVNATDESFFFHIFDAQTDPIVEAQGFGLIDDTNGDEVETARSRFVFTVPHEIQRDTLYIHAQIEVSLQEIATGTTRRLLLNTNAAPTSNKISHFLDSVGILFNTPHRDHKPNQPEEQPQKPHQPQQPIHHNPPNNNPPNINTPTGGNNSLWTFSLSSPWMMAVGGILAVILSFNILFLCYVNCSKQTRNRFSLNGSRRNGYESVKPVDSAADLEDFDENDSEMNAINADQE